MTRSDDIREEIPMTSPVLHDEQTGLRVIPVPDLDADAVSHTLARDPALSEWLLVAIGALAHGETPKESGTLELGQGAIEVQVRISDGDEQLVVAVYDKMRRERDRASRGSVDEPPPADGTPTVLVAWVEFEGDPDGVVATLHALSGLTADELAHELVEDAPSCTIVVSPHAGAWRIDVIVDELDDHDFAGVAIAQALYWIGLEVELFVRVWA